MKQKTLFVRHAVVVMVEDHVTDEELVSSVKKNLTAPDVEGQDVEVELVDVNVINEVDV